MSLSLSDGLQAVEAIGRIYSAYQQLEPANKEALEASIRAFTANEALVNADVAVIKTDVELIINIFKGTAQ